MTSGSLPRRPRDLTSPLPAQEAYLSSFSEGSGYLNFASYGPPSTAVVQAIHRLAADSSRGASSATLHQQDERALAAISRLSGFARQNVALTSSTSLGLMQIAFGLPPGAVLVSAQEFPANLYPWWRAEQAGVTTVRTLLPSGDPLSSVTPDAVRSALAPEIVAVAVSAVDFRTGFRADLAGIRDVIGDRLLVVDAIQAFGALEMDWAAADVIVAGGQKWLRAGWGTGFLALSARGLERLRPTLGGWTGVERSSDFDGVLHDPLAGAGRLSMTNASPYASGALAAAAEQLETVGVGFVHSRIEDRASELIDRLRRADVEVLSPREPARRGGIVIAGFSSGRASRAFERLQEEGVTATRHGDRIRFSVHASTDSRSIAAASDAIAGGRS